MAEEISGDPVEMIRDVLRALNAQEIRLTKYIARLRDQIEPDDLLEMITSEKSTGSDKSNYRRNGSIRVNPIDGISKLEAELDKVHGRKLKALETLAKLQAEREKATGADEDLAAAWLDAVMETDASDAAEALISDTLGPDAAEADA